jgi:hypothetical protein
MKYNLKNRPKITDDDLLRTCEAPFNMRQKYDEWFVGFEAEHRKKEKFISLMPEATIQHLRDKVRAYEKYMKEMLGE